MKFSERSAKKSEISIQDYYAIKIKSIWLGLKQESPAFWWLCFYIFLEYVRPASLYPVLDILPWAQIALVAACVTALSDKSISWVSSAGNFLILTFFLVVLLASILAFRSSLSWDKIDIPINWVILYFLVVAVVNTEKRFFVFVLLFLLVNFKMSQHGFFSFAKRGFAYTKWGVVGSPGWFRDSGDFGIAMLVFFPVAFAFTFALKEYWGRYKKWLFYFIPISGVVTVIATSSRGAQLGMVAVGVWFLLKSRKGMKAMMGIIVVGGLLYAMLPDRMLAEYQTAGDDRTSQARLEHWEFGLDVIRDNPLIGVGFNNWLAYCNYLNPNGLGIKDKCQLPHNTYIEAGAELGIIGLLLYVSLAFYVFKINARTRANSKIINNKLFNNLAHGLDGGLVGYLVATIFFSELFYPVFWMQLSMSVALNKLSDKKVQLNQ